jgi:uncharacterized protein (TIGR03437 family)
MLIRPFALLLCAGLAFAADSPAFPVLSYSTYLRDSFTPNAIATDSAGNIYLAGYATVDPSIPQTTALIVKLNPQATEYLYVRYFGGSLFDAASAIAVDSAGNAYVAGYTASPDFPVTPGGNLGTAPAGISDQRSFVVKLDPNGVILFSDLLGGSTYSQAQSVAVNAAGQVLVSGISFSGGFPVTAGAYGISDTTNHPYLLELDPTGTKTIFSATGIGGTALALDSSGNIYIAGTTYLLDYPTTPGAYQTTFPVFGDCDPPCPSSFQGANQYVTKLDSTGSKLIYSTSVSGNYNTTNGGLAVDSAGDVYLTGFEGGLYPFTVTVPTLPGAAAEPGVIPALPFLTKLDPLGQKLLFSVPVGGAGVQLDSKGSAYVGGMIGLLPGPALGFEVASLPVLAAVPAQCLPNTTFITKDSYVSEVDGATGNLLGTQFIGGSTLLVLSTALSGSTLWLTGATNLADFPFSPNALTLPNLEPGQLPGAYLGAVDFSRPQPPAGSPQIGCIVDAADLAFAGPVAPYQLLTIFGSGLGPANGVAATNNTTGSLAGVDVSFGSTPAPLLYVSATQINFAVPATQPSAPPAAMQVTVNGVSTPPLQLPLTYANPSLFLNLGDLAQASYGNPFAFIALALNADGSVNSSTNPAQAGSVVSVFLNGISPNPEVTSAPLQLSSNYGWTVTGYSQATPFVVQVTLQAPSQLQDNFSCQPDLSACAAAFAIFDIYAGSAGPPSVGASGLEVGGVVYVTGAQ